MAYSITKTRRVVTTKGLVTFDQFYEIGEENVKADLLEGKIIRDSPAVPRHAHIVSRLNHLISSYAEKFDPGEVLGATATGRLTKY